MHDGPGVRTTVFFKGCPLKCRWCHNPETVSKDASLMFNAKKCVLCGACESVCDYGVHHISETHGLSRDKCVSCGKCVSACPAFALELAGKTLTVDEIIDVVLKDKAFYGSEGGLTVSGGEPTFQFEGLIGLLSRAKLSGISTCVETCGAFNPSYVGDLCEYTDTVLFDVKDTDAARLKENTGAELSSVLSNFTAFDKMNVPTVIRAIMIPEVNMNPEHYRRLSEIYKSLNNVRYIELLPYHPYGISKAEKLGLYQEQYSIPSEEAIASAVYELKNRGVNVKALGSVVQ